jgi:hypothetical protein
MPNNFRYPATLINATNTDMNLQAKAQIVKCIMDLATRSKELGDDATYANLLVVAASMSENSEDLLAQWLAQYAKARIILLKEEIDSESSGSNSDTDTLF